MTPTTTHIEYNKAGNGYQLTRGYRTQTAFRPKEDIVTTFMWLSKSGQLDIFPGFWWNGTSGPVIDRKTNMRAGCGHDGAYDLMIKGLLPHSLWPKADEKFAQDLEEDGAWRSTVWIDMAGLKIAQGRAAHPKNRRKVYSAP